MSRPKVFHLITRFLQGGAEAKTLSELAGLRHKYAFTLGYGASFSSQQLEKVARLRIPTKRFGLLRHYNLAALALSCVQIYRYLKTNRFDIVHTHSTEAGIVGRLAARLAGVPVIVHTLHGIPFTEQRNPLLRNALLFMERQAASWTTCLIDNAQPIREAFLGAGIGRPEQYATIHSGIDLKHFAEAKPRTLDLPGVAFKVLMAGRLVPGKGFVELLQAAERLVEHNPNLSFLIAGDGPLRPKLEREIKRKGLSRVVHLLGHQTGLAGIMKAVDAFVLPSYREGTPRVISEAMAAGLPVIATRVDGIPEQVEDGTNGYLIEPRKVEPLVQALLRLFEDEKLRHRMGQASLKRVQAFSQEAMIQALDVLYHKLLDRHLEIQTEKARLQA